MRLLSLPHHIAKVIDKWAAEVRKESGGDIDVQIFGASSLVGAREHAQPPKAILNVSTTLNFQ